MRGGTEETNARSAAGPPKLPRYSDCSLLSDDTGNIFRPNAWRCPTLATLRQMVLSLQFAAAAAAADDDVGVRTVDTI